MSSKKVKISVAAAPDSIMSRVTVSNVKPRQSKTEAKKKKVAIKTETSDSIASNSSSTSSPKGSMLENSRQKSSQNLGDSCNRLDDQASKIKRKTGINGPSGLLRKLTPRSKQLKLDYERVKYKEDEEILPWQRQLKVNRFMAELQVRQNVHELVDPIVTTQTILKSQVDNTFIKTFESIKKRLVLLEQSVFGDEGPETRFDKIEKEQLEQSVNQKQHYKFHNDQQNKLETKVDNEIFQLHNRVQKVELFEKDVKELYLRSNTLQESFDNLSDSLKREQIKFLKSMNESIEKNTNMILKNRQDVIISSDRIEKLEALERCCATHREKLEMQIIDQKKEIFSIQDKKLNSEDFALFVPGVQENHRSLCILVDRMNQSIDTTANFMEKYQPIQVQRAITHVLGFVFPQKDVAWRLNWYNELRMPLLATSLLNDHGKQSLFRKMQSFDQLIQKYPTSTMEIDGDEGCVKEKDELTDDERLLSSGLRSMKLHAKAKVLIFEHLDRQEKKRDDQKKKNQNIDDYELQINFKKLQEELFALLCKEDPDEAKKLGILPGRPVETDDFGVKIMDEDEDNGLETQVQEIVEKFTRELEQRTTKRIQEVEDDVLEKMNTQVTTVKTHVKQQVDTLEKADHMIHLNHINDFKSFRGAHKQFLKATDRLDQKLKIVVDLESAYQLLLQHMQNTTGVVNQLIDLNVDAVTNTQLPPDMAMMTRTSSSPEVARRTYNLNYMLECGQALVSQEKEDRQDTMMKMQEEDSDKQIIYNVQLKRSPSESIEPSDGQNDYKQEPQNIEPRKKVALYTNDSTDVVSQGHGSNHSVNDSGVNLQNYFNPLAASKIGTSSVRSVKNHQFMNQRGNNSRFKQFNLGTPINGVPSSGLGGLDRITDNPVFAPDEDAAQRPKSQAASGFHARARRYTGLVTGSALSISKAKNSVIKFDLPTTQGRPSQASMAVHPGRNNARANSRGRLNPQSSCRTTQIQQTQLMKGKVCNMHQQQRNTNSVRRSFANQKHSNIHTEDQTFSGFQECSSGQGSHRMGEFNRSGAIQKLKNLNLEAQKLSKTVNGLMYNPSSDAKKEEEKIKKKVENHKKALNMLPNADQFKKELMNFKQELNKKSAAHQVLEKQGGFMGGSRLHQLNFATQGINMNFGIGHERQKNNEQFDHLKQNECTESARDMRKHTPNMISSEQEFGQYDCDVARDQLTNTTPSNGTRKDHIFCKKEVMNSVSRVL